jgi:hypothetical protein
MPFVDELVDARMPAIAGSQKYPDWVKRTFSTGVNRDTRSQA